jgi:serpin B
LAFTDSADFTPLSPVPLVIDRTRQATFLRVDGQGTTAAAVTSVGLVPRGEEVPAYQMTVDRPFIFGIMDNVSGELLLIGQIADPRIPQ